MADPLSNQLLLGGLSSGPAGGAEPEAPSPAAEPEAETVVDPTLKDDLGVALGEFQSARSVDAKVDAMIAFLRLARGLI